ncbi:type II secretion system protein N [Candidatus Ichthyocystis sparus]|nr:type II secretion system protein N [Candidatus Ichthyocystis sparus]
MNRVLSYSCASFLFSKLVAALFDIILVLAAVFFLAGVLQFLFFSSVDTEFSFAYPTNAYTSVSLFGSVSKSDTATSILSHLKLVGTMILSNGHGMAVISDKDDYSNTYVVKVGDALPDGSVLSEVAVDHAIIDDHGRKVRLEDVSNQDLVKF